MLKKLKHMSHLYLWIMFAIVIIWFASYTLYVSYTQSLYESSLRDYQQSIDHEISVIFEERRTSAISIALALAENSDIRKFLCDSCQRDQAVNIDFDRLLHQLDLRTNNGLVWLQIIDRQGVSRYRSWTPKVGDSLIGVRYDVKQMLSLGQVQEGVSVGRFSLTFKSMVPIFDDSQTLMGIVEVISHMDPLIERLEKAQGVSSVILVDDRFKAQLSRADQGRFLGNFYIAHKNADSEDLDTLNQMGAERFTQLVSLKKLDDQIVTQYVIQDSIGRLIGYWFTFNEEFNLDFNEIRLITKQFIYASIMVALLSFLLLFIYFLQRQTENRRTYYRTILNTTSEIILVIDREKIIDVNNLFYEFYTPYKSVREFSETYSSICDTFEPGSGFLQREMNGKGWMDYVLENPEKEHIAKIKKAGKNHYFQIKMASFELSGETLYSIIMHDVTQQIGYKRQLEQQVETDPLTGIANRLVFNRHLMEEHQRSIRYKTDLCMAIFDLDHFKSINDEFGHDVGDQALRILTAEISTLLRETDVFCRIGGEEFAVIMPETTLDDAYQVAERIRASVEDFSHRVVPNGFTISIGLGSLADLDSEKSFFKKIDRALYLAKEKGRNRLEMAKEIG